MITPSHGAETGPSAFGAAPAAPCAQAQALFAEAADPALSFVRLSQIRGQLTAMNCANCVGAFDTEVKFRTLLSSSLATDQPSPDLAVRISDTLASIDLSQLDVSDIDF